MSDDPNSPEFVAGYREGINDGWTGILYAVRNMATRRDVVGKKEAAQVLRELDAVIVGLLASRGVTTIDFTPRPPLGEERPAPVRGDARHSNDQE